MSSSGRGVGEKRSLQVQVAKDLPGVQGKWTERAGVSASSASQVCLVQG